MDEQEKQPDVSYEVRVTPGRRGADPNASDWEVLELEDGVVQDNADIYDNLTLDEANQMAEMWTKKKDEAEAEARLAEESSSQ
ncbi:MAG TPA: hypothetical protein VGB17_17305 [Pyrinomonadaceae bacterium]